MDDPIGQKCTVNTVEILGSKWNRLIIWSLRDGALRFTELKKRMDDVNSKTIAYHLKALERCHIISRRVFPETPPRVEYALTDHGKSMIPIFEAMIAWSEAYAAAEAEPAQRDKR